MKKSKPIVVKQSFSAAPDKVWEAITIHEQMVQWYFDNIPAFEPMAGFYTRFSVQSGGRNFEHIWRILEVEPGKMIKYSWEYEEYPGYGTVTFEISEKEGMSQLKLTNEGLETFPKSIPEFKRKSCEAGWKFFIKKRLKSFLDD